ncbi:MAG: maleylpyruvate isomerase N-terminal domain-containing protein [Ilumatobacteraceae bacterium]
MKLTPRYGPEPLLGLDGDPLAVVGPTVRQRRRLVATLASFDDSEWDHPSRCAGWTTRDVVVHLDTTNSFWAASISAGTQGQPTRFLTDFDPVASPAQHVAAAGDRHRTEVFERFAESTEAFAAIAESLTPEDVADAIAEAPPGHISVSGVLHHALWDAWIHERDILLPLGREPVLEPDEVAASLRYAAALGPALALTRGEHRRDRLTVSATDPAVRFDVVVDDRVEVQTVDRSATATELELNGDAVELVEALSMRLPLPPSSPTDWVRMRDGLAVTFDSPPS